MLRRSITIAIAVTAMLLTSVGAEQQTNNMGMSYPMQQSMNPEVWTKMMAMMMDPSNSSPMENCALCHEGEDLARYAEQFGPMMDSMFGMYKSMSPHQTMQYMGPMMGMMDPNMYMNMMGPMMGMMGPMMGGMMNPMAMMMNPMAMMGPMMGGMMNPMAMMGPMMGGMMNPMGMMMNPMGMMNPMMGMGGMTGGGNAANPMGSMMDPKQYESWFDQMTKMMESYTSQSGKQ